MHKIPNLAGENFIARLLSVKNCIAEKKYGYVLFSIPKNALASSIMFLCPTWG